MKRGITVHRTPNGDWLVSLFLYIALFSLYGCNKGGDSVAETLNGESYRFHYVSLDSTEHYALAAMSAADAVGDDIAESYNNLAFADIAKMNYAHAKTLLDSVFVLTGNNLEYLVANVQLMRLCQRQSNNKDFYFFRENALACLDRVQNESELLTERQLRRLEYARSELSIVSSTYFYYVGLAEKSSHELLAVDVRFMTDTAQILNYLYNVGAGGIIEGSTEASVNLQEMECLMRCYQMATASGNVYFQANSLEAMAEHLSVRHCREDILRDNNALIGVINEDNVGLDLLPINLAARSLELFTAYGDVYQIAGAYRTLATCECERNHFEQALYYLKLALADDRIFQAPDLVASIREQLSVVYAAMNNKVESDNNRNVYLDLQEQTRQDRSLEARAQQLYNSVGQLNQLLLLLAIAIFVLLFLLCLFRFLQRKSKMEPEHRMFDEIVESCQSRRRVADEQHENEIRQLKEQVSIARLHLENEKRINVEQRAKASLVASIMPLIDRINHESSRLETTNGNSEERKHYIGELVDNINEQNIVLTHWIQLRQGTLRLKIESFPLQPLFDIVSKGRTVFERKNIKLNIEPTDAAVKADRVLTLFMLNTLADNARKFTQSGGSVVVNAQTASDMVEISVSDTGCGMSEEQQKLLFRREAYLDQSTQAAASVADRHLSGEEGASHGFGLINCKGIIEAYKKASQIFAKCDIQVESSPGKGSRFFFRLPRAVTKLVALMAFALLPHISDASTPLQRASIYADSAYFCNVRGQYMGALLYADSCLKNLNAHYRNSFPLALDTLTLMGNPKLVSNEIAWLHKGVDTNFSIILDIRNETAIAALALHQWHLYSYNNKIYTQLFKELSADATLDEYCRKMQRSQVNKTIAVALLIAVLVFILLAFYFLFYRHLILRRLSMENLMSAGNILVSDISYKEKQMRLKELKSQRMTKELNVFFERLCSYVDHEQEAEKVYSQNLRTLEDHLAQIQFENDNLHVNNSVLDNSLSSLKHETMYYPSRIRQLLTAGEVGDIVEISEYYQQLYSIFNLQIQQQASHPKLHLSALANDILGDRVLVDYLLELIERSAGEKSLAVEYVPLDNSYMKAVVKMPDSFALPASSGSLFVPYKTTIPFLICRQIVRDHGEATNRRLCGIWTEQSENHLEINIILPRKYAKLQSNHS